MIDGTVDTTCKEYWDNLWNSRLLAKQWHQLVERCQQGGSEKAVKRHTEFNKKLLVRRRLELLLDDQESFLELGRTAGLEMEYGDVPGAGMVAGWYQIQVVK